MKQSITQKQWDEIDADKKFILQKMNKKIAILFGHLSTTYPNIGQMIEFLDDDFQSDNEEEYFFKAKIDTDHPNGERIYKNRSTVVMYWEGDLCDLLWKAVKYKLKQKASN